jgi:hypothetical protein
MKSYSPTGDWYTPEMQHADRVADAVIDEAAATIRQSDELLAELDAKEEPATQEEINELRALVTGRGRTPQWAAVLERISHGEITWRDLVEGRFGLDSEVQAAFASLGAVPPLSASQPESVQPMARSEEPSPQRTVSDDDFFDDFDPFDS